MVVLDIQAPVWATREAEAAAGKALGTQRGATLKETVEALAVFINVAMVTSRLAQLVVIANTAQGA